jgi:parallel beta-helix repeat protein
VVQRDNIVIDGAGYFLQGTTGAAGIDLSYRNNVTIRNMQISGGFFYGIYLWNSLSNNITANKIVNTLNGIMIQNASNNNIISANNVTNCASGISLYSSSNNILRDNIMSDDYNFAIYGTELSHFFNDIDISNTINGKLLYYLINAGDLVIDPSNYPELGFLALVNCTSITVQNQELANNGQGVLLAFTTGVTVTQNHITDNSIGVGLYSSSNNIISENYVTNNNRGIQFSGSSVRNSISANEITRNENGIILFESSTNTIARNNITNSQIGIRVSASSNNIIYNNNFLNNTQQVHDSHIDDSTIPYSQNFWDFGYPVGGNYWSNYTGVDEKNGPDQDKAGSDGIGDTPYIIYENNKDNYPLVAYSNVPVIYYPVISIVSPENKTYTVNNVSLAFTVSEPTSWMGYSLDDQTNVTISGNTTLTGLSNGLHNLTVYATNADGKTGTSETVYFTISAQSQPSEPFPLTWIIAAIALIAVSGVAITLGLIYRRRRRTLPAIKQRKSGRTRKK